MCPLLWRSRQIVGENSGTGGRDPAGRRRGDRVAPRRTPPRREARHCLSALSVSHNIICDKNPRAGVAADPRERAQTRGGATPDGWCHRQKFRFHAVAGAQAERGGRRTGTGGAQAEARPLSRLGRSHQPPSHVQVAHRSAAPRSTRRPGRGRWNGRAYGQSNACMQRYGHLHAASSRLGGGFLLASQVRSSSANETELYMSAEAASAKSSGFHLIRSRCSDAMSAERSSWQLSHTISTPAKVTSFGRHRSQ